MNVVVLILALLTTTAVRAKDQLFVGESLLANKYLEHRPYKFIMQSDCNLVLYLNGKKALWNTGTNGQGTNCMTTLQSNGELVVSSGSDIIWTNIISTGTNAFSSSNTAGSSSRFRLIVQGDGNVVIYGADGTALWATNTVQSMSITSKKHLHK